jgi:hypothetical protein
LVAFHLLAKTDGNTGAPAPEHEAGEILPCYFQYQLGFGPATILVDKVVVGLLFVVVGGVLVGFALVTTTVLLLSGSGVKRLLATQVLKFRLRRLSGHGSIC